jgi:hypothetical protein
MTLLSRPPLLAGSTWAAFELSAQDAPALQAFLNDNPLYSEIVNGRPFGEREALEEITERPLPTARPTPALWSMKPASGSPLCRGWMT